MKSSLVLLTLFGLLVAVPTATSASRVDRIPGVRSPSGNIQCLYVAGSPTMMLCTIKHSGYAAKLQARCMGPGGSGVDWNGFTLTTSKPGSIVCSGGVLYDESKQLSYVTLAYGKSWRHGVFTCTSRVTGLTCRSRAGHGLFISRQAWRAW
jgi:hypothetical protein